MGNKCLHKINCIFYY